MDICGDARLLLFLSPTGWAANDTKITVEAGYGGVARPGDIMSVYVTVESSRFVSGEVQVEYGGNKMSHSLAKEAGTKQSVSFSMPVLPNVQEVRVQFLDAQTQRQQEEKAFIRLLPAETIIVGLISEAPEQLGYISEMKLPFPDTYNIVPCCFHCLPLIVRLLQWIVCLLSFWIVCRERC